MTRPPDDHDALTESEIAELQRNLSKLSGPSVEDFYRQAPTRTAAWSGSGAEGDAVTRHRVEDSEEMGMEIGGQGRPAMNVMGYTTSVDDATLQS